MKTIVKETRKSRRSKKNSIPSATAHLSFETQRFTSMCDTRDLDDEVLTIIGF